MKRMSRCVSFFLAAWLSALALLPACRQTGEKKVEPSPRPRKEEKQESPHPDAMPAVTIDREAVGEIGSFDRLTPALFIELTIIYRKEMKEWLQTARTLDPGMQQRYLEKANRVFFNTFGITEKEYLRYGERNQEELNRYLEEHPELLEDAMG